ncbi:WAHD domain of WASH complex family protein [Acanthocheilonema viteae]|uniref:WH2 domain-containing protein n=1 Tax=Acanthocheilonema viteae TaxID=6277 RepID=A0A498S6E7_ACAVI|nr:unnamed protein product [Acanthocheilonema viteae]
MSVCMIPNDASHEEAVEWIVFGLEQLINLSNEIFERLANRIKNFTEHANRVQLDLKRVAKKIEQIREINTAVVISAPSKFIKTENECQQSILGQGLCTNVNALRKINAKQRYDLYESKDVAIVLDEKQKFYRFTERGMKPNRQTREIPDNLQSAADFLLFNTTLNVYTDRRFLDPFDNVKIELHMESESKIQQSAPMADDSTLTVSVKQKMDPLQYQPEFGSLQNFSLPELLFTSASLPPDSLIVRNSSGRDVSNTAESVMESDINTEEISTKLDLTIAENTNKRSSMISENVAVSSRFLALETSETYETSSEATSIAEKIPSSLPPAAPPPPPPPAPPIQLTTQVTMGSQLKPTIICNDDRANLMEAIRRAGGAKGAKLRSIRKREEILAEDASVLPKRNVLALSSSNDLMSSLAQALEQRRKGIFGKKSERREPTKSLGLNEGAFAHMSARIPPPPPKEDNDEYDDVDEIDDYEWE